MENNEFFKFSILTKIEQVLSSRRIDGEGIKRIHPSEKSIFKIHEQTKILSVPFK